MKKILSLFAGVLCAAGVLAQLPYGQPYTQADYDDVLTTTEKIGTTAYYDHGVKLGDATWGGFNFDPKAVVIALGEEQADTLTFCYFSTSATYRYMEWYVAETEDGVSWTNIWTTTGYDWSDRKSAPVRVAVSPDAMYLKFCYTGNFAGCFTDVEVTSIAPVTTALDAAREPVRSEKVFRDGRICIRHEDAFYDLNGVRVY